MLTAHYKFLNKRVLFGRRAYCSKKTVSENIHRTRESGGNGAYDRGILLGISRHKCDAIHCIVKDLRTQNVLILLQHCMKKQEN